MKGTPPIFAANGIRFNLEHFALGGQGGSRTHSPIRNGFTVRRDSPTSPPTHIKSATLELQQQQHTSHKKGKMFEQFGLVCLPMQAAAPKEKNLVELATGVEPATC